MLWDHRISCQVRLQFHVCCFERCRFINLIIPINNNMLRVVVDILYVVYYDGFQILVVHLLRLLSEDVEGCMEQVKVINPMLRQTPTSRLFSKTTNFGENFIKLEQK